MPSALNEALKQSKCDISAVIDALNEEPNISGLRITQKGSKRLISLIKEETDKPNGLQKVLNVLSIVSQNDIIVNQIVNAGPDLSSICDKLLSKSISSKKGDIFDQKSLIIIFDLINQSDKLKSQLCMSIQEYILTSIEQKTIQNSILPKSMEILVSCVTHHQENRTFFIKNTSKEKIAAVFKLTKSTGNTMVQIFSVEFLWRVAIPMRMSIEERNKIFGKYAQQLYAIKAESFREGILNFVENINLDRTDSQRILHIKIKNLMIGSTLIPGTHNLYFGADSILLWINKNVKISQIKRNIELVTLRKSDISGIGISESNNNNWCIGITQDFDTLPDFFDVSQRSMFFTVIDDYKIALQIAQQRFGKIRFLRMPKPRPLTLEKQPLTPNIQSKAPINSDAQRTKKKSMTPKTAKSIVSDNTNKEPEKVAVKSSPKIMNKLSSFKTSLKEKQPEKSIDIKPKIEKKGGLVRLHKNAEIEEKAHSVNSSDSDDNQFIKKKKSRKIKEDEEHKPSISNKKQIKPSPKRSNKQVSVTSDYQNDKIEKRSLEYKKKHEKQPSESDSFSSSDSDSEINQDINSNLDQEEIPLVKIGGSYKDDDFEINDENESSESSEPILLDNDNDDDKQIGQQIKVETPSTKIDTDTDRNEQGKFIEVKKRREYTPEKWELDTFDELKNFGSAIRSRLSERHLMLNRAIEDTVAQSLKEISDFMAKCDSDLDQLRNDFTNSSHQISCDIDQKKNMVMQLGEQQSEHITQMLHDCELLQKRAKELVKRFAQQKKALLTNQEKHIALFREDMRAEVKAAMTTKKRESSKKLVQKLVTLLDEL